MQKETMAEGKKVHTCCHINGKVVRLKKVKKFTLLGMHLSSVSRAEERRQIPFGEAIIALSHSLGNIRLDLALLI